MVERDEAQVGRLFGLLLSRTRKQSNRIGCLNEESLAAYLQGDLNDTRRREIEEHLAACAFCVDEVVAAHQAAQQNELDTVPQPALQRVIGLIPSTRKQIDVLNLVVRLLRDTVELVTTSGEHGVGHNFGGSPGQITAFRDSPGRKRSGQGQSYGRSRENRRRTVSGYR